MPLLLLILLLGNVGHGETTSLADQTRSIRKAKEKLAGASLPKFPQVPPPNMVDTGRLTYPARPLGVAVPAGLQRPGLTGPEHLHLTAAAGQAIAPSTPKIFETCCLACEGSAMKLQPTLSEGAVEDHLLNGKVLMAMMVFVMIICYLGLEKLSESNRKTSSRPPWGKIQLFRTMASVLRLRKCQASRARAGSWKTLC